MHLNSETALDLIDGTISEAERHFWQKHLDSCRECTAELNEWSALIRWARRAKLVSAPPDVLASAKRLYEVSQESRPSVRQIVASIIFDSFAQPATAGIRAGVAAGQIVFRHVVLRAEEFDIHVRIATVEDHLQLLGQILPRGSRTFIKGAWLHLRREEERLGSVELNHLGEFQFNNIPDGLLSLQIDMPHVTVISALHTTEYI